MKKNSPDQLALANIGVITALPEEYAAVCEVLGCNTEIDVPGEGAGRKYSVGKLKSKGGGKHVVAAALLSDMGNNSAAIRATQMGYHCPNIGCFIMVGIAGAIPNPQKAEDHVRLGDIVVTDRNGVVQYDLDKEEPEIVKHRHPPRPPGASLLEAVRSLIACEARNQRSWDSTIEKAISKLGKNWKRPPSTHDNLQDDATSAKVTQHPKDAKRHKNQPRIFHGPIASANKLLKNSKKRDALGEKFGAKAVEMEGSGLADSAWNLDKEYLVIRGTCDYCNSTKGDEWHNYAAIAAAAYARSVIEKLAAPVLTKKAATKRKTSTKTANEESSRIQHERDVAQLNEVLYWVNVNVMNRYIDRMLNDGRLSIIGMDFCDFFGAALSSAGFSLYDKKAKRLVVAFYKAWHKTRKYSQSMDLVPNGREVFFPAPGDYFASKEQEKQYNYTTAQAQPLRKALDSLLNYIRSNYLEINVSEIGREAVDEYTS